MKLLFLTGSRGEWGYIRPILKHCRNLGIEFSICATNMHLLPSHGLSVNEIENDGFEVSDKIYMSLQGYNHFTMAKSLGIFLMSFVDVLMRVQPDWIVLAGDRGEQLVGAIAGGYTYTPVAHIQAGELSGNIDGMARHAIGKFVHLHLASNEDAGQRLIKLGEEPFRVKVVGAPQLDELVSGEYTSLDVLCDKYNMPLEKEFLLVIQHPVTEEYDKVESQIDATVEAVNQSKIPKIWIMPNNDAGSEFIKHGISQGRSTDSYIFKNLPRRDYLGFLKNCSCIVGNSSSALLEAPTFTIPSVNIGRRQANRVRGKNVIDVPEFDVNAINESIRKAMSSGFRESLKGIVNPYGDGNSSQRIAELLVGTPKDSRLLTKQMTY